MTIAESNAIMLKTFKTENGEGVNGKTAENMSTVENENEKTASTSQSTAEEESVVTPNDLSTSPKVSFLCRVICRRPMLYFGVTLAFHLSIITTTVVLYGVKYDIFPVNADNLPLDVTNSDIYLRQTAWLHRSHSNELYNRFEQMTNASAERKTRFDLLTTYFIYKTSDPNTNILTKRTLEIIADIENKIYNEKLYQRYFCYLQQNGKCEKPHSILRLFDGTYAMLDPVLNDPNFTNINSVLLAALRNDRLASYGHLLGLNLVYNTTSTFVFTNTLLTLHYFGFPLSGYKSTKDTDKRQLYVIRDYLVDTWYDQWKDFAKNGHKGLVIFTRNLALYFYELNAQLSVDSPLLIGSFAFIFLFAWCQTGSLWLSFWGVLNTVFSFITGNLVYNVILDFKYIGGFHLVSVFIILGIAADNIFIFCDAWKSLGKRHSDDITQRLSRCYATVAKSMLVTSVTTAAAFLLNSFSPILAMSAFGTYSGVVILINYIYVVTFYPVIIVIWQTKFYRSGKLCRKRRVEMSPIEVIDCKQKTKVKCTITANNHVIDYTQTTTETREENHVNNGDVIGVKKVTLRKNEIKAHNSLNGDGVIDSNKSTIKSCKTKERCKTIVSDRVVVRFFAGPYFKFISNRIAQLTIMIIFIGAISMMVYFVTTLKSDDKKPRTMVSDHPMEVFDQVLNDSFHQSLANPYGKLYIVWGLQKQNTSECHRRKYDYCTGQTAWDDYFDLNPAPAQKDLLDFCHRLSNMTPDEMASFRVAFNKVDNRPAVKCFMQDMDLFYKEELALRRPDNNTNIDDGENPSIPLSETKVRNLMLNRPQLYNVSELSNTFYRYFETAYAYWISGRYERSLMNPQLQKFSGLIGEEAGADVMPINGDPGAVFGTRLRYAAIEVELSGMHPFNTFYKDGLAIYDKWETFVKESVAKMAAPLRGAFQTTLFEWHWFHTQDVITNQAILSVALSIAVAWLVLVLSSGNWIVGTMAMITIATICLCVIGVIPLAGWKYGLLEAMNTTLVVGLAVDYVVHLSIAYNKSPSPDRQGRVHHALQEYGISVLSGAVTTLGSSFFMFFAKVAFCRQFGSFMFATIGFSIVFALTFFVVLLMLIGPQNKIGSNRVIVQYLVRKFFRSYFSDKPVDTELPKTQQNPVGIPDDEVRNLSVIVTEKL